MASLLLIGRVTTFLPVVLSANRPLPLPLPTTNQAMIISQQLKLRPLAIQKHISLSGRGHYHAAIASLLAAASVSAALLVNSSNDDAIKTRGQWLPYQYQQSKLPTLCHCEHKDTSAPPLTAAKITEEPRPLSRFTLMLHASKLYPYSYLRVPRLITPTDPLFSYPDMKRGIARRRNDEEKIKQILSSPEVMAARQNNDQAAMNTILQQMNSVAYGKGVTAQMREDFLMQYGCTGYTESIVQYLVDEFGSRGIVEVGAGNGQWARALSDHYNAKQPELNNNNNTPKAWDVVLASDNMKQLPLSLKVYHKYTVPSKKYFFDKVQRSSHIDAVQKSRGRALLLVYPPPGPMALQTVLAYLKASPDYHNAKYKNDTVVYVGEGRGGANADESFFDYFLSRNTTDNNGGDKEEEEPQWILEKVMDVHTCPGGKGYEKMFVFQRK